MGSTYAKILSALKLFFAIKDEMNDEKREHDERVKDIYNDPVGNWNAQRNDRVHRIPREDAGDLPSDKT